MERETRAMQEDGANPGMLSVLDGEALWQRVEGSVGKSCASCHGEAPTGMRGVAARYPAFDAVRGQPVVIYAVAADRRTGAVWFPGPLLRPQWEFARPLLPAVQAAREAG